MLKLFNSFSSKNEDFQPFEKSHVKMFICGPTLYDFTHFGHARIFLTYDLLCRYLQDKGYNTDVLVNMTDINQSVFNKAIEKSTDYYTLTRYYSKQFAKDLHLLGISSITRLVHVSDYVKSMEKHISHLLKQKIAYSANGNIYLDTSKVQDYGRMSKQSREQLRLHRLDIGPNKRNQEDIMLWNCSEDFGFSWNSEFGKGIPWWHMQDTTVSIENFGSSYDIHGGAKELIFPHHEAHLAQFKMLANTDTPVKIWMHIGLVLSKGEKMSKSLGNIVLARDLVHKYGQNLLRLYLFSTHYHNDIDFVEKDLLEKKPLLEKISLVGYKTTTTTDKEINEHIMKFFDSLDDDLNSPEALGAFDKICTLVMKGKNISNNDFDRLCRILGIKS